MALNKLLPLSRQLLRSNGLQLKSNVGESSRQCHIVCVPPRNKFTTSEKVVYGLTLSVAMLAGPFWVLYHIPEYQKEDRHVYSGK